MTNEVLSPEKVTNLINILIAKFNEFIDQDNMRNEVDEIGENLCILIGEGREGLEDEECWEQINTFVEKVADMNHRDHSSLTSKVVFKFMDLSDN